MNLLKKLYRDDDGQVTILFAVMLIALLGVAALSIDGGRVYHTYNEAVNIAEIAALAGAKELNKGVDVATETAYEYARLNGAKDDQINVTVKSTPDDDVIEVTITTKQEMIFGGLFGVKDREIVGVHAVSRLYNTPVNPPVTTTPTETTTPSTTTPVATTTPSTTTPTTTTPATTTPPSTTTPSTTTPTTTTPPSTTPGDVDLILRIHDMIDAMQTSMDNDQLRRLVVMVDANIKQLSKAGFDALDPVRMGKFMDVKIHLRMI